VTDEDRALQFCPNHEHDLGDPYPTTAKEGPLEGDWLVYPCSRCDAYAMGVRDRDDDALGLLLEQFRLMGLPEPTIARIAPGRPNTALVLIEGLPLPPPATT
jgi:hypothetical protein